MKLTAAVLTTCSLAGCASEIGAGRGSAVPPLSDDQVSASVEADVKAPIERVYDYVVREDTPARDLRAYGFVPGVRGDVRVTPGGWDYAGARRVVVLEDGSTLKEEIEQLDPPRRFRYRVHDFGSALKALAIEGRGYWSFTPTTEGTHVRWTYVFTATSCPARPALRIAVATQFEPYMTRGLASIRSHIEAR